MQGRNCSGLDAVLIWRENGVRIRELPLSCASNGLMRSRSRCRHREDRGPRTEDRRPTTDDRRPTTDDRPVRATGSEKNKVGKIVPTLRLTGPRTQIPGGSSELATVRSQRLVARALRMLTAQDFHFSLAPFSISLFRLFAVRTRVTLLLLLQPSVKVGSPALSPPTRPAEVQLQEKG